jgi:hypothetical protein
MGREGEWSEINGIERVKVKRLQIKKKKRKVVESDGIVRDGCTLYVWE